MKVRWILYFLLLGYSANAQYTILHSFNNETPAWGSLLVSNSKLYGMTNDGGTQDSGSIFSLDTNGNGYTDLFNFNGTNGKNPCGSLTISGSKFFGMARFGGAFNMGCAFSVDSNGTEYNDLYNFDGGNSWNPWGSLTLSGNFLYGMTDIGNPNISSIFRIDTIGYTFSYLLFSVYAHGGTNEEPVGSVIVSESVLYSMSIGSLGNDDGSIIAMDTNGQNFRWLLVFNGTNGRYPEGSLTLSNGKLYGMTYAGGINDSGCIYSVDTNGGDYKKLLDFNGINGSYPIGSLILAGSRLYGVTSIGGMYDSGCIFSIDTNGNGYTDMFDFNTINGGYPVGSLTLFKKTLYGMASSGGTYGQGVIFSFKDTNIIPTSVNIVTPNKKVINIYPNPSNGNFTITIQNLNQSAQIEIYNMLGDQVFTELLRNMQSNNTINLNSQPNGVYFYRVISDDETLYGEGKLIIQK